VFQPERPPARDLNIEPSWSPDGKLLIFTHLDYTSKPDSLYRIDEFEFSSSRTTQVGIGLTPAFRRDGQAICFIRAGNVFTKSLLTGTERQLTYSGDASYPSWSPDGSRLAFARLAEDPDSSGVWLIGSDGTGAGKLGMVAGTEPVWSPVRDELALIVNQRPSPPSEELALVDLTDTTVITLTNNDMFDRDPSWSSDGSEVIWCAVGSKDGGIYDMAIATKTPRLLVAGAWDPSRSPDGYIAYVAYSSRRRGNTIWKANGDGSQPRELALP
jgi:Tol biopolymer transport system component